MSSSGSQNPRAIAEGSSDATTLPVSFSYKTDLRYIYKYLIQPVYLHLSQGSRTIPKKHIKILTVK